MFKKLTISILLLSSFWIAPAHSATQTFSYSETVTIRRNQTAKEVQMFAHLHSSRMAMEQAGQYLHSLPQVNKNFSLQEAIALSVSLYHVNTFDLDSGKEIKTNIFVDTDTIPVDLSDYIEKNPMMLESIQNHLKRSLALETAFKNYLNQLEETPNASKAESVRQELGSVLKNKFESNRYFIEGSELLSLKRWQDARNRFDQAITLDPEDAENYFMRAITYIRTKNADLAIKDLDQAIKITPNWEPYYFLRGLAYTSQGVLLNEGLDDLNKAIKLNPENRLSYYLRGYIYRQQGRCAPSKKDYTKACSLGFKKACNMDCNPIMERNDFKEYPFQ